MKIYSTTEEILCDTFTPISAFLSLRDQFANVSLFESSDYSTKENAHSFIGVQPLITIQVKDKLATIRKEGKVIKTTEITSHKDLSDLLQAVEFVHPELKDVNGFFGVIGYDAIPLFEDIEFKNSADDLPEIFLTAYQYVLVFDHFYNKLRLIANSFDPAANTLPTIISALNHSVQPSNHFELNGERKSAETDESYKEKILLAKENVRKGDVFQIVISRAFQQGYAGDDFEFYRHLRTLNPSPYMFYFDLDIAKLIGASPEAQVKLNDTIAEIHPIAGTVRKSDDEAANRQNIEHLKSDEKENAEHIMLVDLARNDLNRSCTNVKVEKLKEVQHFSHVIHLVSKVTGQITNQSALDVFAGSFPAGTLSGAPKYRAMELIDEYETSNRNYYGGAIGFISASGNMNMAIVIRSALSYHNQLHYRAGAGVVMDSTADGECQEVFNKIGSVEQAIKNAAK